MRRVLLIVLVLFSFNAQAQLDWWNQVHNWDGATPWTHYMKYSHAYLGPNAIPIPTLQRPITGRRPAMSREIAADRVLARGLGKSRQV